MKKYLILILLSLACIGLRAQDYNWAIGVRGGVNDSGVTLKHILSDYNGLEFTYNYQYGRDNMIRASVLSLLYEWNVPIIDDGFLLYYGLGAHVGAATMKKENSENYGQINLGAVGVFGLEYKLYSLPLAFSLDYRPFVNVLPQPRIFFGNIGLGIKFCF
ncbi:MAG: hypothetical protein IJ654_09360 [Bacteroidales bacterium]|nr:hypothetical protein [Bacteroidales bacterium]